MGSASPLPRARALVLETNEQEAAALLAALTEAGFAAEHATRPGTASALLQVAEMEGAPFEVLVVSTMVSGICGLDLSAALALRVKARPATFLSSGPYSAPEPGLLARAQCAGVILKPLRIEQFQAALATAIPAERLRALRAAPSSGMLAI